MRTLYARREPSTDSVLRDYARLFPTPIAYDVVLYSNKKCNGKGIRLPWHFAYLPKANQKKIVVNCEVYNLKWLDDLLSKVLQDFLFAIYRERSAKNTRQYRYWKAKANRLYDLMANKDRKRAKDLVDQIGSAFYT